jgi:hypothetical protein
LNQPSIIIDGKPYPAEDVKAVLEEFLTKLQELVALRQRLQGSRTSSGPSSCCGSSSS